MEGIFNEAKEEKLSRKYYFIKRTVAFKRKVQRRCAVAEAIHSRFSDEKDESQ